MANLATNKINKAIALGKRNAGTTLPEVKVTATPLKRGSDIYHINGQQVSHDDIVAAAPANQKEAIAKYLNTFRVLKGGTETVNGKPDTINSHYVLNSAGTKNDLYDTVNTIAKTISNGQGK